MSEKRGRQGRGGFSIVEMMLVVGLVAVVIGKVMMLMGQSNRVLRDEMEEVRIEDHARRILDQIALGVMGSDRDALAPILTPGHSTGVRFQVSLGFEDGAVVWSDQEEIAFNNEAGRCSVTWSERPGEADERSVVWSTLVRGLLEGEAVNGVDDNGNGLVDEEGLNFVVDGNQVTIRLSMGTSTEDGETVERSLETVVSVRNNPQ